jgi:hypothetical protein
MEPMDRYSRDDSPELRAANSRQALDTIQPKLWPDEKLPFGVDFYGTCPGCGHDVRYQRKFVAVAAAAPMNARQRRRLALKVTGEDLTQGDKQYALSCACDQLHPDRPSDETGCGARFDIRVQWP